MRVATFNIRYDNVYDKENSWEYRKEKVKELIRFHDFDVFGLQEALNHQLNYINDSLEEYDYIGIGREDGVKQGEFAPIFYKKEEFRLIDNDTFWLSETPSIPSISWNSACVRICTYAKLLHIKSSKEFIIMNTHFDHESEEARYQASKLIVHKANELVNDKGIIILGDFNSPKSERCYKFIDENFNHVRDISRMKPYGPEGTFNEFNFDISWSKLEEIDHIFINDKFTVNKVGTLTDNIDRKYPSDHFPVVADIKIL